MSHENKIKFNEMVRNTNWNRLLHGLNNVNDMVIKLLDILDKYYNTCFPLKTKTVSVKRLYKPWITKALLRGCDKSDPNNYRPISSLPLLNKVFEKTTSNSNSNSKTLFH